MRSACSAAAAMNVPARFRCHPELLLAAALLAALAFAGFDRAPAPAPATALATPSTAAPDMRASAAPEAASHHPSGAVAAPTFAEASLLFRDGRHAAAYGRFVTMANEGDMHAARVALVMHRFGATLFGSDWDATTEELAEWSRLARSAEQADVDARLRPGGRGRP